MTAEVEVLRPRSTLAEVLALVHEREIRHVPVVNAEGELLGLVTHRDLLRQSLSARGDVPMSVRDDVAANRAVEELMTTGVMTIEPEATATEAAELMLDNKLGCLPVTEGTHLVGILTEADFVKHVAAVA
jgi:CBS domain-containing membrane protein